MAEPVSWLIEEKRTHSVIGAFYAVYRSLGYGFLEHVYCSALEWELRHRGHDVARQVGVTVHYKDVPIAQQRLDMLVDGMIVVEIKASETIAKVAARQLQNYLRATSLQVGLLLHFGPTPKFYRLVATRPRASDP
jgi:GxxExxY protein